MENKLKLINRWKKDERLIENLLNALEKKIYTFNYYLLGDEELAGKILNQVMINTLNSLDHIDIDSNIIKRLYMMSIKICMKTEKRKLFNGRADNKDLKKTLKSAIIKLPFDQRVILILHDIQKLDYDEISEVVEMPLALVSSNLGKARLAIKKEILISKSTYKNAL